MNDTIITVNKLVACAFVHRANKRMTTQACRIDRRKHREMQAGGPKTTRNYASEWETSAHTALMTLRTRPLGRKHLHDGGSAHVELLLARTVHDEQRGRGHNAELAHQFLVLRSQ